MHVLDTLVRTERGRSIVCAIYRGGIARETIDDALARELADRTLETMWAEAADDPLARDVAYAL